MRVSLLIFLSLFSLCCALLSVEEIRKRINEAYVKEQEHVEAERLSFVNDILPNLEKAIIKGNISTSFRSKGDSINVCWGGKYGDIRPAEFCDWWKHHFTNALCSYTNPFDGCPLTLRFSKK